MHMPPAPADMVIQTAQNAQKMIHLSFYLFPKTAAPELLICGGAVLRIITCRFNSSMNLELYMQKNFISWERKNLKLFYDWYFIL